MNKDNLYWAVYRNLEKELLELSNQIHIDDKQLSVYSIKIAELLIRCSVEIESIAKELYEQEGGNMSPIDSNGKDRDLYFDTDCLDLLENKWLLSKKVVFVSATTLYFQDNNNKILTPLHNANKRGTSAAKWKQAYQGVKHNRYKELSKGNLKNLIHAMGALYLLNIYYKNLKFTTKTASTISSDFDVFLGSDIFSIKLMENSYLNQINRQDWVTSGVDNSSYVYLTCYPQNIYDRVQKKQNEVLQKQKDALLESTEFQTFISSGNSITDITNMFTVVQQVGTWYYKNQIKKYESQTERLKAIHNSPEYKEYKKNNASNLEKIDPNDIDTLCDCVGYWLYSNRVLWSHQRELANMYVSSQIEIVLNKNQAIYPTI